MNVGSLFSGIGGLDLGLERAGMSVRWQCEIDPYCRAVLAHHWPGVKCYEDIRNIDGSAERVDLICGGFPCQPVSLAGKGLAQKDPRWLWPEFARVVGELRPSYVLVENVPGLVKRGLDIVVTGLAEMGYDAEWEIVSAAACGAPHLRERIFVVAHARGQQLESDCFADERPTTERLSEALADTDSAVGRGSWPAGEAVFRPEALERSGRCRGGLNGAAGNVADANRERELQQEGAEQDIRGRLGNGSPEVQDPNSSTLESWRLGRRAAQASGRWWWTTEPNVGRVAHGVPNRLAQLRALGNAVVPQVAEAVGRMILEGQEAA